MARKNKLNPSRYGLTQQEADTALRIHAMCKSMSEEDLEQMEQAAFAIRWVSSLKKMDAHQMGVA